MILQVHQIPISEKKICNRRDQWGMWHARKLHKKFCKRIGKMVLGRPIYRWAVDLQETGW
jgi:hypothetical protein